MVLLYFVNAIFELSIFTILHVNLKLIEVTDTVEKSIADLVLRIIMIPLVFIITSNILLYSWRFLKWIIVAAIIMSFMLLERILVWLDVFTTHHWNLLYTLAIFSVYAIFSRVMVWIIVRVDKKEVKQL